MEIRKNEKTKTISIWMTGGDQQDEACVAQVEALISKWHAKGWLPVIFRSGGEDLYMDTLALLKHNRDLAARREVEAEKASRQSVIEQLHRKPEPSAKTPKRLSNDVSL